MSPDGSGVVCSACGEESPPKARFCPACGTLLSSIAEAERRIVTVLFADLTGFTHLSEQLDAEDVRDLISGCLDPLCAAVTRWGGFVDKFIGDCVMALFGAPIAYENEPERAVRAALEMQEALTGLSSPMLREVAERTGYHPLLTVGIATGPVVTGLFSGGGAHNYTAVGDTVNVASRLQGLCDPGQVIVDEATFQQTRHIFDFDEQRLLPVKGRVEPVATRYVRGVLSERLRVRGLEGRRTPLVGREAELAGLKERWRETSRGRCVITLIAGPAGIGKSRLVEELMGAEDLDEERLARGRSYPYASSTPWEPVSEMIRHLHRLDPNLKAAEAAAAIAGAAGRTLGGTWTKEHTEALSIALGCPVSEVETLRNLNPEERAERISQAIARAMAAGAPEPRLLLLEDLHWADRATLAFLTGLSASDIAAPVMLILVARPPLPGEEALTGLFHSVEDTLLLQPLAEPQSLELLDRLLEPHEVPPPLLQLIAARSEGNPLFLEELVKSLFDSGALRRVDGVSRSRGDEELMLIPDSIESVLSTRIDGLGAEAKRVLQYAAIVGRRFWSGVVSEALVGRSIEGELEALERGSLVRPQDASLVAGDREFVFEHLMLHEVAYSGLLKGLRADLHGSVGTWLEEHLGARSSEYDGWIAFHYERSKEPWRAVSYLERAAESARERGALSDAGQLIARAVALVRDPEDESRLLGSAEEIAIARGDVEERLRAIESLEALARELEDERLTADAEYRQARLHLDGGDLSRAREFAESTLARFRALEDISLQGDALRLLGRIEHLWGRYPQAIARYEAALRLEGQAGDRAGQADMYDRLGLVEVDRDDFLKGLRHLDTALQLYRDLGHRPHEARVLAHRATALRWLGSLDEAEATAREALRAAEESGSTRAYSSAEFTLGMILAARGTDEAQPLLRKAAHRARTLRRQALEANAWLAIGETAEGPVGEEAIDRALELGRKAGLVHIEIRGLTRKAQLALIREDLEAADEASARAIERLRHHGNVRGPEEAVYYTRARALRATGHEVESAHLLLEASRIVREKAELIGDPELRSRFLELAPGPEILQAAVVAERSPR